ncbi:MAG: hypothetical protein PHH82_02105 [Candidatus ainarchaeum sp.]|nr:hypothetical protein [Candidatus ainarchaeum sp.]
MPKRLREVGRKVAIGVGAVAAGLAAWAGLREHKPVERAYTKEVRTTIESKRPFSLDRIFYRQAALYSKEKHNRAVVFHKEIVTKMFGAGKPYYKRQVTSVRELEEILGKMYAVLNEKLPAINSTEATIADFFEAHSRKKRDCDIGTILFLETLRTMNLKNVDFLYGHRYGHGFLYVKLDGRNYRYETMQGKFMPLLEEDVAFETHDLENYFRFNTEYNTLAGLDKNAAKEKIKELMRQSHTFEVDYTYALIMFEENKLLARELFRKAYSDSKYSPRIGLGWAALELTTGDVSAGIKILEGVKIPGIISVYLGKTLESQIQILRIRAYATLLKESRMKTVISLISGLKKKLDSVQKVY